MPSIREMHGHIKSIESIGQLTRALQAVRQGKAALILLDDGASANTRRRFENAAISHQIPLHILPPGLLESATGKAKAIVAALPQGGLTDKVRKACVENLHQKGQ